ncbi:MAG: (2Fe-2S)-binding protein [Eubacteriales bacterium]|nr:(2Fe-2S)-binding protein [Eubacteriales bacterium]
MSSNKREIQFVLNGNDRAVFCDPTQRLLDIIRDDLRLTGTKEGCGIGECGACTVVLNDRAVTSCLVFAGQADGGRILTVEGLADLESGRVLQECFVEKGAVQCGFCTPGMLMSAYALLLRNPNPTRDEIRLALSGNLCRCTGYLPILDAVEEAASRIAGKGRTDAEKTK